MQRSRYQSAIDTCNSCAQACSECATACIQEKGQDQAAALARCAELALDCADICRLAVSYMSRGSELAPAFCKVAAQVCEACAGECARHSEMAHCRLCAAECRRCASECRRLATMDHLHHRATARDGTGLHAHH